MEKGTQLALKAIGMRAEAHAKEYITVAGRVVTGRMRNSIAYTTLKVKGKTIRYNSRTKEERKETVSTGSHDTVYVGTNVDYAIPHELGSRRMSGLHMLKRAVADHTEEYKDLAKRGLKSQE